METTWKCAGCGVDVPQSEAAAVAWTGGGGRAVLAYLCPACKELVAGGKFPRVRMGMDGRMEAVPSVPAEAVERACARCEKKAYIDGDADCASCDRARIEQARRLREMSHGVDPAPADANTCAPDQGFYVGEPVVDEDAGKVTIDVGLRPVFRGEFGHCNEGPTQNRPWVPERMKEAYDEILANTRRADPPGAPSLVCSDERTAEAIRKATSTCVPKSSCCPDCDEFEAEMAAELERDQSRKSKREHRLREVLAAYAHEAWSGWMRHQVEVRSAMSLCRDGRRDVEIWEFPYDVGKRWARQMRTPYAELPEAERASDRAQADKILAILRGEK